MSGAFVRGASWWTADLGPPRAELLPRAERSRADFCTRILAHVMHEASERGGISPAAVPWVLGCPHADVSWLAPHAPLRSALEPSDPIELVCAGPTTAAMIVVEALAMLTDHETVLVAVAQDATSPYHEALASALVLTRTPLVDALVLEPPVLRRHSGVTRRTKSDHPLAPMRDLARAALVRQPTLQSVPPHDADRPENWQIELHRRF